MTDPIVGGPAAEPQSNGLAVAAMIVGIAAIVLALLMGWIPFVNFLPLMVGIVGLVLSIIAIRRPGGRGMAMTGLVCSGISLVFIVLSMVFLATFFAAIFGAAGAAGGYSGY